MGNSTDKMPPEKLWIEGAAKADEVDYFASTYKMKGDIRYIRQDLVDNLISATEEYVRAVLNNRPRDFTVPQAAIELIRGGDNG